MREILFRGKSGADNKWYYGYLEKVYNDWRIFYEHNGVYYAVKVDPNTVGQFVGLVDKNGALIFEGDILQGIFYGFTEPSTETFTVHWDRQTAGFRADYFEPTKCEVIGNIHDNPRK